MATLPRSPLPVVLLGGVNLVRTLGLAGIPAVVAMPDAEEPAFASRYCTEGYLIPPFEPSEAAADAIVALGRRITGECGRRVPLMYGSDDALQLIYAHRERLQRYFLFLVNDPGIGEALLEKDRFDALAQARGLPVPKHLDCRGNGPGSVAAASGPVLVKPRIKTDWHQSALRRRLFQGNAKARIFESGAEALADPIVALFREQLLFQEFVSGDDGCLWSFHGVADEDGQVLDGFVGRKLRTYPPLTGESAFIELDDDEELLALGCDIAARLPLKGVFKMDFKKDAHTGVWHLLEINARFNLWHYLGACNGVNLMRATYDYLVEGTRPLAPQSYETTYRWLAFGLDYRAFRAMRAQGELGTLGWALSILLSRNVYNLFSWRDPGPWLRLWNRRLARRWDRGSRWLLSMVRQWRSTAS
jgi:predicted ATP-grasp superfamily ATP-dependent carboligase